MLDIFHLLCHFDGLRVIHFLVSLFSQLHFNVIKKWFHKVHEFIKVDIGWIIAQQHNQLDSDLFYMHRGVYTSSHTQQYQSVWYDKS